MAGHYELVIFDCDGTLVDSLASIAQSANLALIEAGLTEGIPQHAVAEVVGLSLEKAIATWLPTATAEVQQQVFSAYRRHYQSLANTGQLVAPLFPGVRSTLESLKKAGITLAVATGKSTKGLQRTLQEHNLDGFFQSLQTADTARSKPDPEMIEQILAETGFSPSQTLMVGDTTFDIEMGAQAGVTTCAVTYGCHSRAKLAQAKPHHWLDQMADLPPLLGVSH